MSISSAFTVITDNKVYLRVGGDVDKDFDFDLPGLDLISSAGILAFVCFTESYTTLQPSPHSEAPESLFFKISINSSEVLNYTLSGPMVSTLHEVIQPGLLKREGNHLTIRLFSGKGRLSIGDLVMWYHQGEFKPVPLP